MRALTSRNERMRRKTTEGEIPDCRFAEAFPSFFSDRVVEPGRKLGVWVVDDIERIKLEGCHPKFKALSNFGGGTGEKEGDSRFSLSSDALS